MIKEAVANKKKIDIDLPLFLANSTTKYVLISCIIRMGEAFAIHCKIAAVD